MRAITVENYRAIKDTPEAKRLLACVPRSIDVNTIWRMQRIGNGRVEIIYFEKSGGNFVQRRDTPGLSVRRKVVRV